MIGFGLDLAGYTTNKTSLAAIEFHKEIANVFLLRSSSFSRKRDTAFSAESADREEASDLQRCIKLGRVAVDIPIDLQGLPLPAAGQIWELTLRPIDNELRAMAPFADRIGAPVARFMAIMRYAKLPSDALGRNLFETYPTAIWQKLGIVPGAYKSRRKERAKERTAACIALCEKLRIGPHLENDDDIDAVICAVTAIAPDDYLCQAKDYNTEFLRLPIGYRLLRKNPFRKIRVHEEQFVEWMNSREKHE
jgi:Protein of unknown function (DUF429)